MAKRSRSGSSRGGFKEFLFGRAPSIQQSPIYSREQLNAIQQILSRGQQMFNNPYEGFEPIRQNALNTFKNDIIPYLTNQFNSVGGTANANHFGSSILQTNLSSAGSTLASRLAAAQSEYGQRNQQNALSAIGGGLRPLTNTYTDPGSAGLFGSIAPAAGRAIGGYFGGPMGAGIGEGLGSAFGGAFQGYGSSDGGGCSGGVCRRR